MKAAQVAMEVLLAVSIASILIVWISNFSVVHNYETQRLALLQQQKSIARSIATALFFVPQNTTVKLKMPCVYRGPKNNVPYDIIIASNQITVTSDIVSYNESISSSPFTTNFTFTITECPKDCIISQGGVVC